MLKSDETYLKCKHLTIISEKNVVTDKMYTLRKVGLKFQNPNVNISCR